MGSARGTHGEIKVTQTVGSKYEGRKCSKGLSLDDRVTLYKTDMK